MGKYIIKIEDLAQTHLKKHFKAGNLQSIKKIEKILIELSQTPFEGSGKPEALKHELNGFWSRKINQKDRLIYKVEENIVTVYVFSAMGHYYDK